MKLINREPTKKMIEAGWEALQNTPGHSAAVMFRAMYDAAPEVEQEPVAIYHGKCVVDCGDAGHPNVSLLKLIPAGTELYAIPPDAQSEIAKRNTRIESLTAAGAEYQRQCFEQAERINELEEQLFAAQDARHRLGHKRDELAAQNQQLLATIKDIGDFAHDRSTGPSVEDDLWEVRRIAYEALALPDLATPILNQVKAEALRQVAENQEKYRGGTSLLPFELRKRADAIEKWRG